MPWNLKKKEQNRGVPGAELPLSQSSGGEQGVGSAVVREWMEPWLVREVCWMDSCDVEVSQDLIGLNGMYIDVII